MRRGSRFTSVLLILLVTPALYAEQVASKSELGGSDAGSAYRIVDQWFIKLNELDDWTPSKETPQPPISVIDGFVQLYSAGAFHQVGPKANQVGPVVFQGHEGVRKWVSDFASTYVDLGYRIDYITRSEKPAQLIYSVKPPWGGAAVAVEFTAVYTKREDRKRFIAPGSAFFLIDDAGKIQRVRLYILADEIAEISN